MDEPNPELVRQAQRGDTQAFDALVRHCQADVYRMLKHQVRDPELAADLTQETFIRAHQRFESFRGDGAFSGWILRIARNQGIDAQRRLRRRRRLTLRLQSESTRLAQAEESADSIGQSQLELAEALAQLPDGLREVFVLVEVLQYKYRDVAEILEIPEGTVKGRMFRARRELMAWFDGSTDGTGKLSPREIPRRGGLR